MRAQKTTLTLTLTCTPAHTANHVLVPSPLYLGQFISLTEHLVRETSSRTLVLCDEFGQRTARILAEEEVYTSKKTFRVCLIDTILSDDVESDSTSSSSPGGAAAGTGAGTEAGARRGPKKLTMAMMVSQMGMPRRMTLPACTEFLLRNPVNVVVAKRILEQPRVFNRTYTFVRGFEKYAVEKVRGFVGAATDAFVCACADYRQLIRVPRQAMRLSLIISSFVVGNCHAKIWAGLCSCFENEDHMLHLKATAMAGLSPVGFFGLRRDLVANVQHAKDTLATIEAQTTPMEMLYTLQDTIDSFSQRHEGSGAATSVAGDEVLPALVCTIEAHPLAHLRTLEYYMEHFVFVDMSTSALGYSLATFKAAIVFINDTFNRLPPDTKRRLLPAMAAAPARSPPPPLQQQQQHRGTLHRPSPSLSSVNLTSSSSARGIPVSPSGGSGAGGGSAVPVSASLTSVTSVPKTGAVPPVGSVDSFSTSVPEPRHCQRAVTPPPALGSLDGSAQQQLSQSQQSQQQQQAGGQKDGRLALSASTSSITVSPSAVPAAPTTPSTDTPRLGSFLTMLRSKSGTVGSSQVYGDRGRF